MHDLYSEKSFHTPKEHISNVRHLKGKVSPGMHADWVNGKLF